MSERITTAPAYNCKELADALKPESANSLIWYGWVAEDGYWRGHLYGVPTVTNMVTGDQVAVTSWQVTVEHSGEYKQASLDYLGRWSTSGTGSVIDVDSVPSNMQQVKAHKQGNASDPDTRHRFLAVRLYLADGNSIYLSYFSEGSGMEKPDAVTALGGRATATYWGRYTEGPNKASYKSGHSYSSGIYLNTPSSVKDYHFVIEKTVIGAAAGESYTFPVQVSISNGAEMTIDIETTGSGTFSKEISFQAYEDEYTVAVREERSDMPNGVRIITGSDSGVAVLSDEDITDASTLFLENIICPNGDPISPDGDPIIPFNAPATGDKATPFLWIGIVGMSGFGMLLKYLFGKNRKNKSISVK